jgi:hypothetical protein
MRHFGPGGVVVTALVVVAAIITPRFTLWARDPLIPDTDKVKEPVEAEEAALTVSVDVAVDPDGGVTGPGRLMETPEGAVPIHE